MPPLMLERWWTRTQRIRTVAEVSFEVVQMDERGSPPSASRSKSNAILPRASRAEIQERSGAPGGI